MILKEKKIFQKMFIVTDLVSLHEHSHQTQITLNRDH